MSGVRCWDPQRLASHPPRRFPKHGLLRLLLDKLTARADVLPRPVAGSGGSPVKKGGKGSRRRSSEAGAAKENGHAEGAVNGSAKAAAANGHAHQALCADDCVIDKMEVSMGRVRSREICSVRRS